MTSFLKIILLGILMAPLTAFANDAYTEAMVERVKQTVIKDKIEKSIQRKLQNIPLEKTSFKDLLVKDLYEFIPKMHEIKTLDISVVEIELVEITPEKFYQGILKTTEPCVPCENGRGTYKHQIEVVLDSENYMVTIYE